MYPDKPNRAALERGIQSLVRLAGTSAPNRLRACHCGPARGQGRRPEDKNRRCRGQRRKTVAEEFQSCKELWLVAVIALCRAWCSVKFDLAGRCQADAVRF